MIPEYKIPKRIASKLKKVNPLKDTKSVIIGLAVLVPKLLANKTFMKNKVKDLNPDNLPVNDLFPKQKRLKLGQLGIDKLIQRELNVSHATGIAKKFDTRKIQALLVIKVPGKETYHNVDGQHTATVIAALAEIGCFGPGVKWQDIEVPCQYIETNDRGFAREQFGMVNGHGKKKLSRYERHRNEVNSVRIDGSIDEDYVRAERKQSIMERWEIFPVDIALKGNPHVAMPGAVTHIESALSCNYETLDIAGKFHYTYFHYQATDAATFRIINKLVPVFDNARHQLTDELLSQFAAIIRNYFADVATFSTACQEAYKGWHENEYGYETPWDPAALSIILLQVYNLLDGSIKVPAVITDQFEGIVDFLPANIVNDINSDVD